MFLKNDSKLVWWFYLNRWQHSSIMLPKDHVGAKKLLDVKRRVDHDLFRIRLFTVFPHRLRILWFTGLKKTGILKSRLDFQVSSKFALLHGPNLAWLGLCQWKWTISTKFREVGLPKVFYLPQVIVTIWLWHDAPFQYNLMLLHTFIQ